MRLPWGKWSAEIIEVWYFFYREGRFSDCQDAAARYPLIEVITREGEDGCQADACNILVGHVIIFWWGENFFSEVLDSSLEWSRGRSFLRWLLNYFEGDTDVYTVSGEIVESFVARDVTESD